MTTKYKRNFLSEVVARVDFALPVGELTAQIPPDIFESARKFFPIIEPERETIQEIQIDSKADFVRKTSERIKWNFANNDRTKRLIITDRDLTISHLKHDSYDNLEKELTCVLPTVSAHFQDNKFSRIGLRYVNSITVNHRPVLEWSELIDSSLIVIPKINYGKSVPMEEVLAMAFGVVEYNFGAYRLRFNYGIHNPDYPAKIKQRKFILDYDCFSEGAYLINEISTNLNDYHAKINEFFESSITQALRDELNKHE
jgi:uncharacterized protein (TIGR04255 family)